MKRWQLILLGITGLIIALAFTKTGQKIVTTAAQSITSLGINLVKYLEGAIRDNDNNHVIYKDEAGYWTIGYGHKVIATDPYYPNTNIKTISETEAVNLLANDMEKAANSVRNYVTVPLSEGQFNSIVSFVFNIGIAAFVNSTILKKLNSGDYNGASNELDRWIYVTKDGQKIVSDILVSRREQEKTVFLS